jgi:hypothetical protein
MQKSALQNISKASTLRSIYNTKSLPDIVKSERYIQRASA